MAKTTVILNPAAGRGEGRRRRVELEQLLSMSESHWQIVETTAAGSAKAQARQAADSGAQRIIAAGGDGTFNEVLNGIVGTGVAVGVIPFGTGNDFARHVGLDGDFSRAVHTAIKGVPTKIDLGLVDGHYFANIAGCGFDAAVAQRINDGYRLLRGTSAYLAAVVSTLFKFKAVKMKLTIDGEASSIQAMFCSIANASSYGGGMKIAPSADISDGTFNVCILHKVGKVEFLRSFPKVFRGTHLSHPKFESRLARTVRIETERPMPVLIDGEVHGTTPIEFSIQPAAIEFVMPRSA